MTQQLLTNSCSIFLNVETAVLSISLFSLGLNLQDHSTIQMEQLNKSSIPFYKIRNCKVCKGSRNCKLCHKLESRDHLFFKCPIAQVTWTWIRISMGWRENPVSLRSFEMLGSERGSQNWWKLIVLASVTRGVWKTRNV